VDADSQELLRQLEEVARGLSPEARLALVTKLTGGSQEPRSGERAKEQERLRTAFKGYSDPDEFSPGQLVQWKEALRNRQLPEYGQSAVVLEVLDQPVVSEAEPVDSPYYREPLDLVLGVIDGDGDLAAFHFNGRRFKRVTTKSYTV
jgi:hypothetical protein